ncbi:2OG-Fe(II) oxygenase superfamily [Fusarium pseudoanthophilum]|uniref:2OG-Fe(II) oxygenase superfamily n=1 Tax=Fusarium pseudoanthophilum TaxID=48495 RepID=A0A8H5PN92_9HYPO|nr:2OG-Fe(II) oxygenase superfamily [Fusarium pseudoanthophilum]
MASVHTGGASGSGSGQHNDSQSVVSDMSTDDFTASFKEDLLDALDNIQSAGSFAFSAPVARTSDISVSVNGVGNIPLPLGESQAQQIIAQARQAPYGKGSDTLVDTAVRNTWELDPSQFNIGSVDRLIQAVCGHAAKRLGISVPIRAEIYKMLVYEKGAMFKAHTDTEKIPGMFGTLVISLPSIHTGGEVILKHCGEQIIYSSSQYDMSCASWYSDVQHEVLPVTSGYRWVLTYNLAIDQSLPPPSAGYNSSQVRSVRHCLRRWLAEEQQLRENKYVYHVLDYEYTEANVSFRSLKGDDLSRITALRSACEGLPITLFLALLEKKEFGSVEMDPWEKGRKRRWYDNYDSGANEGYHDLQDVFEVSHKIKIVRDLRGMAVTNNLELSEEDLLHEDAFDDIEAEEEYEGFMGNSGPTATHWYRVGAVAIVPHDSILDYLSNCKRFYGYNHHFQHQIRWLANQCLIDKTPDYMVTALKEIFNRAHSENHDDEDTFSGKQPPITDISIVERVLKGALQQHQCDFFGLVLSKYHRLLSSDVYEWVRDWVVDEEDEDVKRLERFDKIKAALAPAIEPSDGFNPQYQVIISIAPLPKDTDSADEVTPTPEPMLEWARSSLRKLLEEDDRLAGIGRDDGSAMADQALYYADPMLVLSQSVVPIFEEHTMATAFRLGFLKRLKELADMGSLPKTQAINLYRTLARSFIAAQDFEYLHDKKFEPDTPGEIMNPVGHEELSSFFTSILEVSTELDNLAHQFLSKVTMQADKLPPVERCTVWLPLVQSIFSQLDAKKIPLDTPVYRDFFSAIIVQAIDGYVGTKPSDMGSYGMTGVHCYCGDCTVLNEFLRDPSLKAQGFPLSKNRRFHVHRELDHAGVRCTHQTVRTTYPETLVVTKKTPPEVVELQNWKARREAVLIHLNQFKTDHLRTVLGANFEKVDILRREEEGQANMARLPVVGDKRSIDQTEIIDLTSD